MAFEYFTCSQTPACLFGVLILLLSLLFYHPVLCALVILLFWVLFKVNLPGELQGVRLWPESLEPVFPARCSPEDQAAGGAFSKQPSTMGSRTFLLCLHHPFTPQFCLMSGLKIHPGRIIISLENQTISNLKFIFINVSITLRLKCNGKNEMEWWFHPVFNFVSLNSSSTHYLYILKIKGREILLFFIVLNLLTMYLWLYFKCQFAVKIWKPFELTWLKFSIQVYCIKKLFCAGSRREKWFLLVNSVLLHTLLSSLHSS